MAELITIKERIERRFVGLCLGITEAGRVMRWDSRGKIIDETDPGKVKPFDALNNADLFVVAQDARITPDSMNVPGLVEIEMDILVLAILRQGDDDAKSSSLLVNRWQGLIYNAITQDINLTEPDTHEKIAEQLYATGYVGPINETAQREFTAGVVFRVCFKHEFNNPYQFGTVATPKTV